MHQVQQVAQLRWQEELRSKLSERSVGTKSWWNVLKEHQGLASEDHLPPLNKSDGTVATSSSEKAEVLADHFSGKMSLPDPMRPTPATTLLTTDTLDTIIVSAEEVKKTATTT